MPPSLPRIGRLIGPSETPNFLSHLVLPAILILFPMACASSSGSEAPSNRGTMSITNRAPSGSGGRVQFEVTNDPSRREVVLDVPVVDVWTVLPAVFADLEIEAPVQDLASFQFGNPEFSPGRIEGRRLSSYLDCGAVAGGSRADRYRVAMQFIVGLSSAGEGTRIRTIVDAYASPRDVSGNAVHCLSRGTLEERLAELVLERLAAVE